jgi:3-hydroxy-9,10-secoandrosta-1,3,5(10)-triene-9,17-dione monooxygenase
MKPVRQAQPDAIDCPEPELTPEVMLERARALRPILRERQSRCEQAGRILDETSDDFIKAGFFRILQPRRFGGYEFSLVDFIRVMIEISRGCSESGWVLALTTGHPPAFLSGFPEQMQREVYGSDGDVRVPAVAMPTGTAIPTSDGYRVSGAWDYSSGCDVSTHFLGALMIIDPKMKTPKSYGYVLLDRTMFSIVDNWNVIGMQGTGSRRVVLPETIVAQHRILEMYNAAMTTAYPQPGRALHANPMFHAPLVPLLLSELGAVAVGTAQGALDSYEEITKQRTFPLPPFVPRTQTEQFQHHFGHARGLIDTAEAALLQLGRDYLEMGRRTLAGSPPTAEDERRYMRVIQQCLELSWQAVELMFRTAGSSVAKRDSMLARSFRNIAVIRTHITMQDHMTSTNIGRLHFGISPLSTL